MQFLTSQHEKLKSITSEQSEVYDRSLLTDFYIYLSCYYSVTYKSTSMCAPRNRLDNASILFFSDISILFIFWRTQHLCCNLRSFPHYPTILAIQRNDYSSWHALKTKKTHRASFLQLSGMMARCGKCSAVL